MHAFDEEYVTVTEAAALLRVAPSTIRRWIREGDILAYRVGRRRVALRRGDLTILIAPIRPGSGESDVGVGNARSGIPRLTIEEQQRGLAALEEAERLNKEILARRGGEPFRPSLDIIDEMREERTRQLLG